jgi:DNA-binding MarR family transcriptional regulator
MAHQIILEGVLKDFGWGIEQINELIRNLQEKRKPGDVWKTEKGWAGLKKGEEEPRYGMKDKESADRYVAGEEEPEEKPKEDPKDDEEKPEEKPEEKDFTVPPENETPNARKKRRLAHNEQTDNQIKNSDNADQTAADLVSERRNNIRNAYDLPAGTPASTTGETYGGVATEQLTENPDLTEEEFVDNELEKMKDTPLYNLLLNEAKTSKEWKKKPEEYIKNWLAVGFRTGKGELEYLESDSKFKYKKPQTKPYPISTTMDYNQKQIVQSLLEKKRDEHKPGSKEYKHYQTQLEYLVDLDDTDTGTIYETTDGRIGFKHTSNKKNWDDPHNNTSVRKKGEKISKAVNENENLSDDARKKVVETTNKAVEKAAETVDNAEKVIGIDTQNLSDRGSEILGDLLSVLGGTPKERNKDYVEEMRQNPAMKKHLISKGINPETATARQVGDAIVEMTKAGTATQVIEKMILKTSDLVSQVRNLSQNGLSKNKYQPMSPQEIADHLNSKGQGISVAQVKAILESDMDPIVDTSRKRKDSMSIAHEQLVGDLQKADSDMNPDSYPNNPDGDNGPNQRAYVQSFMDEIHFTRYINGELEGIQSINIGGTSVSPTEFRECCSELSNFDGDIDSEDGKKALMNHLQKRLRVSPDDDSISFGSKEGGEERELGREAYRTKGQAKSILAHLGKDMINCLKSKN